jgi:hypothetical protein
VTEVTSVGTPVRMALFMANPKLALVQYPATDTSVGQSRRHALEQSLDLINTAKTAEWPAGARPQLLIAEP